MKYLNGLILVVISLLLVQCAQPKKEVLSNFITADQHRLMDGENEFRFLSFNIPNLNFTEDEMEFTKPHPFRLPTSFEVRDALESVKQMGGTVVRSYTLPVRRKTDTPGIPRYVLGPGEFDERSFVTMDSVLAIANDAGIRLIVPLLNNWKWMGGAPQYAEFREKTIEDFWTDPQLIEDFKKTLEFTLNRTNTVTGVKYKDDKSILCWETGNELMCPYSWTKEIVTYMKSIDKNHLVMDGFNAIDGRDIAREAIDENLIDIVTTHHYKLNPDEIIKDIKKQQARINKKKPYLVGEFGFLGTNAILKVADYIIDSEIIGGLIWSLRFHREEGGYYWHSEPLGGGIFKAFHYPGYPSGIEYNEEELMPLYREKAFQIRGIPVPDISAPAPPKLLTIKKVADISWQGSVGAKYYDVERAGSGSGPWKIVGYNVTDSEQIYSSLFNDYSAQLGKEYYYRVIAKNSGGTSAPSNVVGPVKVEYKTLIDKMKNFTVMYHKVGDVKIASNRDREFKEITHRFEAKENSAIFYFVPGNIKALKINSFSKNDSASLEFSLSEDAINYDVINVDRDSYYVGKGDYDYWIPSQYRSKIVDDSKSYQYAKIAVNELSQLARVEIDFVPVK